MSVLVLDRRKREYRGLESMCRQRARRRQGQELGDQMHFVEQDRGGSKLDNQNKFKSDHGREVPVGELPNVAVVLEI